MSLISVFGHFKTVSEITSVKNQTTIYFRYLFLSVQKDGDVFFKNIETTPIVATINQTIIKYVPSCVLSRSGAFAIFITHISQIVSIPSPKAMISLIQSHASKMPNTATSIKLVGFAMIARQNKKPDKTTYLIGSLCDWSAW